MRDRGQTRGSAPTGSFQNPTGHELPKFYAKWVAGERLERIKSGGIETRAKAVYSRNQLRRDM